MALTILTLCVSGFLILMAHPRLYWGEIGNDMTEAWLELPISRNFRHGGWNAPQVFQQIPSKPIDAVRTYDIFNQNGWARSLHFLAAWSLLFVGFVYGVFAWVSGHAKRNLIPGRDGLRPKLIAADIVAHLASVKPDAPGPPYNVLQRWAYCIVLFICLPMMVLSGLTMAPAVVAAAPWMLDLLGGSQSARSLHFLSFSAIFVFLIIHVVMVVRTGFKAQLKAMILGSEEN